MLTHGRSYPIPWTEEAFQRYGVYIRHLLVASFPVVEIDKFTPPYLSFCPNIQNLALWTDPTPTGIELITKLPLTRLSARISDLGPLNPSLLNLLSKITHFDIVGSILSWEACSILLHFPVLTHLAIFFGSLPAIATLILEEVPQIQVLVWRGGSRDGKLKESTSPLLSPTDERTVCIQCDDADDWAVGAKGGMDMWRFAEKIVESRKMRL